MRWVALIALLARAGGESGPVPDPGPYEVWTVHLDVYAHPASYARRVGRVEKGARLAVLEAAGGWSRVRHDGKPGETAATAAVAPANPPSALQGWAVLPKAPARAGDRSGLLGNRAALTSAAMVVKSLDELSGEIAAAKPAADEAFRGIDASGLSPEEIEAFVREGGLRR